MKEKECLLDEKDFEVLATIAFLRDQFSDILGQQATEEVIDDAVLTHVSHVVSLLRELWYEGIQVDYVKDKLVFWRNVLNYLKGDNKSN